eukprot:m.124612 g.124612  ORF g.124612 m.124612 type:complete len:144 (-) comp52185_c0_seq20:270-701(-)
MRTEMQALQERLAEKNRQYHRLQTLYDASRRKHALSGVQPRVEPDSVPFPTSSPSETGPRGDRAYEFPRLVPPAGCLIGSQDEHPRDFVRIGEGFRLGSPRQLEAARSSKQCVVGLGKGAAAIFPQSCAAHSLGAGLSIRSPT